MRKSTSNPSAPSPDAGVTAALPGSAAYNPSEGEGAWSQNAHWNDTSAAPERRWIMAAGGLGFLACLALGAAGVRALSVRSPESVCTTGVECNTLGIGRAQLANASAEDLRVAARLFQRACERGHAPACNNLGLAYESAQGVPQDFGRALTFFERACSGGFAEGCSNQGALHEHGLGVPVNLGDAQRLYTYACRRGSALGCSNLGVLYAQGRSVQPNEGTASRLFAEACRAGSELGCSNLFSSADHPADVPPR